MTTQPSAHLGQQRTQQPGVIATAVIGERRRLREMFRGVIRLDGSIDYQRLSAFEQALGQEER